jgi:hypothetical protein
MLGENERSAVYLPVPFTFSQSHLTWPALLSSYLNRVESNRIPVRVPLPIQLSDPAAEQAFFVCNLLLFPSPPRPYALLYIISYHIISTHKVK